MHSLSAASDNINLFCYNSYVACNFLDKDFALQFLIDGLIFCLPFILVDLTKTIAGFFRTGASLAQNGDHR